MTEGVTNVARFFLVMKKLSQIEPVVFASSVYYMLLND